MTARYELLTLGAMIQKLMEIHRNYGRGLEPEVRFDFGYNHPTTFDSYRGYYQDIAFGYTEDGDDPTLSAFLEMCNKATRATLEGYKGGAYRVSGSTRLWASNHGQVSGTGIVDVVDHGWVVVIETRFVP